MLVVSSSQEGSLILQAMRNGAKEFLSFPLKLDDFLAALDRIRQDARRPRRGRQSPRPPGDIRSPGPAGGVGCTSLAINLACMLAQNEKNSVAIIDLDMALGDADVWLDIIPDYTIQDVAENITRLDYSLLKRSLTKHDCGVFLLPRPVQLDATANLTPDEFRRVIALLKATFTHLVIDVSKNFGPLDMAAMESVKHRAARHAARPALPAQRRAAVAVLRSVRRALTDKIKVVVNRIGLGRHADQHDQGRRNHRPRHLLANSQRLLDDGRVAQQRRAAVMQAPKSKLTKSIIQL